MSSTNGPIVPNNSNNHECTNARTCQCRTADYRPADLDEARSEKERARIARANRRLSIKHNRQIAKRVSA